MTSADAVKRFDFSNSFDTNERGVVAARDFTADDVAKARADAFAEGKEAGAKEERGRIESTVATTLQAVGQRLGVLADETAALRAEIEAEALDAVLTIARKLVPHYAKTHGLEEMEGVIRDCLTAVYDEPRIVVRAHDSVLDHVKNQLDTLIAQSGFSGKVVLFADQTLSPGDCRVEWADGGAERDVSRLWQEVDETISRFLGREPGSDAGPAPDAGNSSQ